MSRATGIEWTDATWNPIRGCSRVSEGCRHCYAETVANRFCGPGAPYEGVVQIGADGKGTGHWNGQIRFVEKRLLDPLRWKTPQRIFVNSMSDLFHENVTDEMRDRIFAVMALCPQHTFQALTKRPERMRGYLNLDSRIRIEIQVARLIELRWHKFPQMPEGYAWQPCNIVEGESQWPLPNVWLGVSVEDQKTADERIPLLLQIPAAVRFLSAEPLLGSLDISRYCWPMCRWWLSKYGSLAAAKASGEAGAWGLRKQALVWAGSHFLDWVICGGESGPGARPMHPEWVRSLRDQCAAAGVPFFFKQWGEWRGFSGQWRVEGEGRRSFRFPEGWEFAPRTETHAWDDAVSVRIGKKEAGNELDGEVIQQFPEAQSAPCNGVTG